MLINLSKNLESKLDQIEQFYFEQESKLEDIVVYGSSVRGSSARDIDLILILSGGVETGDDLAYSLKERLAGEQREFDVKSKTLKQLFDPNFLAGGSIILEGYSLISEEFISQKLNLENYSLFKYNLGNLNKNEKTKFTYALKGRGDNPGIVDNLSARHFSCGVILVPIDNTGEFKQFLHRWELDFKEYRIGMRQVI